MNNNLPQTYSHPLPGGLYYEMALVQAGVFIMGSEGEDVYDDEKPEHLVRLTQDYYIGVYPVTQAIWEMVMGAGTNPSHFRSPFLPVDQVSWLDIVAENQDDNERPTFLAQLNEDFPAMPGWEFRLPTEAEWEYAAKGGHLKALTKTQHLLKAAELYTLYAGSDKLKEVGWYSLNSHGTPKEMGLKVPNELGLYDMSGNIYEWCHDWFSGSYYQECLEQGGVIDNPIGPGKGHRRVLRGGCWGLPRVIAAFPLALVTPRRSASASLVFGWCCPPITGSRSLNGGPVHGKW